ncbi:MAG TPA: hypothetical protein VGK38_05350, partial [Prolixibacteraceae bacterium]
MKILISTIMLLFSMIPVNGQSNRKTHLFTDKSKDLSFFINPTFQFSEIAQQYCDIPGIRAGIIINKKLIIGGLYNFSLNDILIPETKGGGKLQMKWGGLHFEYTLWPLQVVHLTVPFSAGIGQMKIAESQNATLTGNPNFYFTEPGLMIEINIWKYAKLGIGANYRYTGSVSYNHLTANDLNGFSAVASVKFG